MRKTITYGIVICGLFSLVIFFFKPLVAQKETKPSVVKGPIQLLMDTYQGSTVTISGTVTFPEYKEGQRIRINARSFPGRGLADIASIEIPQPGDYSLKVPQDTGDVYIGAMVLEPGERGPSKDILAGIYANNPLKVGRSNIEKIDITIRKIPFLVMDTYQGPTVTISGTVTFPEYKEGQRIRINARSFPDRDPADIASIEIPQPGDYSLKVPQDTGDVYIDAMVLELGERGPSKDRLKKQYAEGQPIKVKASDISGINIMF